MPDPTNPPSSPDSAPVSGPDPKPTRRRFLQGGLAAAPVLMTLVSRPVLAQQCATPSGFISGNASRPGEQACTGHGPDWWLNNLSAWTLTRYNTKSHFKDVFANNNTHYPGKKLPDVLALSPTAPYDDVARYIIAALLNAQANLTPVRTCAAVQGMWSEYLVHGCYTPSSGVTWNHDALMQYMYVTCPA
jgi:hypothetical protein